MIYLKKIGLIVIENKKVLLCEPYAFRDLITLGGIKEGNETAIENLTREIKEELGPKAFLIENSLKYLGQFSDVAAGTTERVVEIELYIGQLGGTLVASSEIKKIHWVDKDDKTVKLSPIVKNKIIPYLINCSYL